jgi:hypothetical protein
MCTKISHFNSSEGDLIKPFFNCLESPLQFRRFKVRAGANYLQSIKNLRIVTIEVYILNIFKFVYRNENYYCKM